MAPYNKNAQKFFTQYQSPTFEQIHSPWLPMLDTKAGLALDVGAGSGRDALALVERGWDVVAVEPACELRRLGEVSTDHRSIQWLDDALPDLNEVRKLSYRFDLILVSAVWMHFSPTSRARAFRILTELLGPSGMPVPLPDARRADELKRANVWWETAVYRLPELLRGITGHLQ